mgnify:CR=1 FL=1
MSRKDSNGVNPERKTSSKRSFIPREKYGKNNLNLFSNFVQNKVKMIKTTDNKYLDFKNVNKTEINSDNSKSSSINSLDKKYNEEREKQLELLNIQYSKIYNQRERKFSSIVNEIEAEENLFYKKSIMSFDLIILKIKCFLQILKEKITAFLKTKIELRNFYEIESYIQKIKSEFNKINRIIDKKNKYEYEMITQVYSKFLYILSNIYLIKDDYVKSLSYISLGINMLRVFFIRREIATDVETYKIYAKLLIMFISKLILDKNISESLVYINFLSKVCQVGLNMIEIKKLDSNIEYKFIKYLGYNFLLCGYCFELNNKNKENYKEILAAYKQSFYFLNKYFNRSIIPAIFSKKKTTLDNLCLKLASFLHIKMKEKVINEAREMQKKYERLKEMNYQLIEEEKLSDKKYRLKLISRGLSSQNERCKIIENRLYNQILTQKTQNLIDKLDSDLVSYAYKNETNSKNIEKVGNSTKFNLKSKSSKKVENTKGKLPSINIMKNMSRFKIYNSLMSRDFKDFVIKNDYLAFNNPENLKLSLEKIQTFFNHKIAMDSKVDKIDKDKTDDISQDIPNIIKTENDIIVGKNYDISSNNKTPQKINATKKTNYRLKKREYSIDQLSPELSKINDIFSTPQNRPLTTKIDQSNLRLNINQKSTNNKELNKRNYTYSNLDYDSNYNYRSNSNVNSAKKLPNSKSLYTKSKSFSSFRPNFINKKFDKYTFSHNYFKKLQYLENLTNKELDFQKKFLEMKNNNSKLFFKRYYDELNSDGTFSNEEIYKSFLILNNKATEKFHNYEMEMKTKNENKKKPRIIGNVFKSVTKGMKEGRKARNVLKKVFDQYISEGKKINEKKKLIGKDVIDKRNQDSIMKLNNSIKKINNNIVSNNRAIKEINKKSK